MRDASKITLSTDLYQQAVAAKTLKFDITIIGAGSAGIAAAYYISRTLPGKTLALVDQNAAMSFTSAQTGENYRNWWPQPCMSAFTDQSIRLLDEVALESGGKVPVTRGGYLLATRQPYDDSLDQQLRAAQPDHSAIRVHAGNGQSYRPTSDTSGVDVLCGTSLIQRCYPTICGSTQTLVHIRRAGDFGVQQAADWMLRIARDNGLQMVRGAVTGLTKRNVFMLEIDQGAGTGIESGVVINAAGPFAADICEMLGETVPIKNYLQQKIAFVDSERVVPRNQPFMVDLDHQTLEWTDTERQALSADDNLQMLCETMPGGVHCRPDGGPHGSRVKLGWAFNNVAGKASFEPQLDDYFPDLVVRGASRLQPGLARYIGRLPRSTAHYGGWYTMTAENLPLIGPSKVEGFYLFAALSGFGSMAAFAGGKLLADTLAAKPLPDYADDLSIARYQNAGLMTSLSQLHSRGIL